MYIIGGKYKKKTIQAPHDDETRPTSAKLREALFNICQFSIEGALFLDLFAGSGAIGLEALSRGAQKVIFVEKSRHSTKTIKANIAAFKEEENTEVFVGDVFIILERFAKEGKKFDIIFADPPYGFGLGEQVIEKVDRLFLLNKEGVLFIEDEHSPTHLEPSLHHLTLKTSRRVGRTSLKEFTLSEA